jgi:integrase/recombinase XerC
MEATMDKGQKATTVNTNLAALRTFYRFALARNLVNRDPAHQVLGPKKQKPLPQFLRENEMNELLDKMEWGEGYKDVRARTIILLFYETGLRRAELRTLDNVDVDLQACQLKVTGKRNKQRIVPFGEEMAAALRHYVEVRDREVPRCSEAFFVNEKGERISDGVIYNEVKKHLSRVSSLKKRSPHVLRHTFATAMLNHDAGLESVRKLLGHEILETTEIYTHTTFDQLKRVYKEAHPRG